MKKVKMLVELEYDDESMHSGDADRRAKQWFMDNVLLHKDGLIMHSNEICDTIGTAKVLEVYPF